jgi:hypothetical protein
MKSPILTLACILSVFGMPNAQAQWLEWDIQTESRMDLFTVANSDEEEKDLWPADLNKDGWTDVIVVRKEPFSASSEPPKSDLLLINQQGVLVDMTIELAPEFISNPSFALTWTATRGMMWSLSTPSANSLCCT